jgi:hypothetical protein
MSLSDEATEKNLLIQLADRDIISHETILERFKEIPEIEKIRLKRETSAREEGKSAPKASPYHDPKHKQNLEKIALQSGKVTPQDVGLKTSVPKDVLIPKPVVPGAGPAAPKSKTPKNNGRPPLSNDTGPRKQRIANPKSKPGVAELVVWSETSWEQLSDILTNAYLKSNNKKNLRQLTKAEVNNLEQLKVDVLTNLPLLEEVNEQAIARLLSANSKTPLEFAKLLKNNNIVLEEMPIDTYRRSVLGLYIEQNLT